MPGIGLHAVTYLKKRPGEKFTARQIVEAVLAENWADFVKKKTALDISRPDVGIQQQLVAELGAHRPQLQKTHPNLMTDESVKPKLYYWRGDATGVPEDISSGSTDNEAASVVKRTVMTTDSSEPSPDSEHQMTQAFLVRIGRAFGFDVWVAKNDRSALIDRGLIQAEEILSEMPVVSNNAKVKRIVELIDVLWFNSGDCTAAFEVECTTSVYSGLLRMSDLVALQPNIAIALFIVAPSSRREKVFSELLRPTFRAIGAQGLDKRCKYLSIEKLEGLKGMPEHFLKNMNPNAVFDLGELAAISP